MQLSLGGLLYELVPETIEHHMLKDGELDSMQGPEVVLIDLIELFWGTPVVLDVQEILIDVTIS